MKKSATFLVALLAASSVFAADTSDTRKVEDAAWPRSSRPRTTVGQRSSKYRTCHFEPEPLKGRTENGGSSIVSQQFNDNTLEAAFKGDKIAVNGQGQWQSIDQADDQAGMMGSWLTGSGTAAEEAGKLLKYVKDLKPVDDALVSDLTTEEDQVVTIATSAASRPRAISTRLIRGTLCLASNVYQRPPIHASNQAEKSPGG